MEPFDRYNIPFKLELTSGEVKIGNQTNRYRFNLHENIKDVYSNLTYKDSAALSPGEFNINFAYEKDVSYRLVKERKQDTDGRLIYEYAPVIKYMLKIFRRGPETYIKKNILPLFLLNGFQSLIHLSFIDSGTKIMMSTCISMVGFHFFTTFAN
jgi:hypothetical protein